MGDASRVMAARGGIAAKEDTTAMTKELLTVEEVAALLDLRPVTIYRWCRAGRLAGVKIGKAWRIPRVALAALLRPDARRPIEVGAYEDLPMDEISPATLALARRLLLHEAGGRRAPEALAAAAASAHERLRGPLARASGATGFALLSARALSLARAEYPALRHLTFVGRAADDPTGRGAFAAASAPDPARAEAALTAVLANLLGLLSAFIGEALVLRLARDAWPEIADRAPDGAGAGEDR